ncbi:hypothetical protein B9T29_11480 [Acinetobacter sp. ANC 3903]|uniref:transposase family protein n=1 Tax=Acinetobacter sp. ANC 3903 TaxID=1977883 RepID=UPI000A32C4A5|nr:hypothetical protein B9T29_11480 [Acinetobacter sp. ANC 3903]
MTPFHGRHFQGEIILWAVRWYCKLGCKLDSELKIYNQEINKRRIGIEHVFGRLKTFKILTGHYRNRGKRLGLRFSLIAGIYNLELSKK